MKNRYQRLSSSEKKEAKKRYAAVSEKNKKYLGTLNRMLILGIIGLIYGIGSTVFDVFILSVPVYSYVVDAVIIIFSVFLITQKFGIESSTLNKFLIDENNANKKVEEEPKKIEVKEEKKEEVKKVEPKEEVKVEPKKVEEPKKEEKVEPKKTEESKKEEKVEPKKEVKPKTEEKGNIEMPKKRKHVSKNSKAKKKAKKNK